MTEPTLPAFRKATRASAGYTMVESAVTLFVAILVAVIAVPLVSRTWEVSPGDALRNDMKTAANVMDDYLDHTQLQTALGGTVASAVPHVGVYSSYGHVMVKVNPAATPDGQTWYCLKGTFDGTSLYYLSNIQRFVSQPVMASMCPA